jgi:peptide deformylase
MAVRPICAYPEVVLRQKAQPIASIDDDLQLLIDDMIETMYAAPGIGLAAPQIGVSLQLFVVDITSGRDANALQIFINPAIVRRDGRMREDEGCLSVPGISGPTPRSERVVIRGTNREGEAVERQGEGLQARAYQHEMDHLLGMLFFDRMGVVGRDLMKRKFKRSQRQNQRR